MASSRRAFCSRAGRDLLAGIAIGQFTPGFHADTAIASQLAEIGVILLMFGVGLHFSTADLMAVRSIAVPGSVAQIGVATAIGAAVAAIVGCGRSLGFGAQDQAWAWVTCSARWGF